MHAVPFRFGHLRLIGSALLIGLAGCGGSSVGGTGGNTGSAGNSGTAGTSGGTAGTSGGRRARRARRGRAGDGGHDRHGGDERRDVGHGGHGRGVGHDGSRRDRRQRDGHRRRHGGTRRHGRRHRGPRRHGRNAAGTGAAGRGGTTGTGGATTQTSTNVTTFHNNLGRTGVYVDAALTHAAVASIHVDTSFANTAIMGPVYAQPLYLGGAGTSQPDMVIVATAQNRVYALNASTGAEVWANMQYGAPVTTQLDINSGNRPLLPFGVIGTPTIDAATRTLYFNAATNVSSTIRHRIHAVDLTNGMEKSGWPVSVETAAKNAEGGAFVPTNQNQRAAARARRWPRLRALQRPHRRRRQLPRLGGRRLDDDADRRHGVVDARGLRRHLGHQRHRLGGDVDLLHDRKHQGERERRLLGAVHLRRRRGGLQAGNQPGAHDHGDRLLRPVELVQPRFERHRHQRQRRHPVRRARRDAVRPDPGARARMATRTSSTGRAWAA